jgi:hypothetical protein
MVVATTTARTSSGSNGGSSQHQRTMAVAVVGFPPPRRDSGVTGPSRRMAAQFHPFTTRCHALNRREYLDWHTGRRRQRQRRDCYNNAAPTPTSFAHAGGGAGGHNMNGRAMVANSQQLRWSAVEATSRRGKRLGCRDTTRRAPSSRPRSSPDTHGRDWQYASALYSSIDGSQQ